jgi:hypothetical protein
MRIQADISNMIMEAAVIIIDYYLSGKYGVQFYRRICSLDGMA